MEEERDGGREGWRHVWLCLPVIPSLQSSTALQPARVGGLPLEEVQCLSVTGCGSPVPGSGGGDGAVHPSVVVLSCSGGQLHSREEVTQPPAPDWWYGSVSEPICHICPCHFESAEGLLWPHEQPQWPLGLSTGPLLPSPCTGGEGVRKKSNVPRRGDGGVRSGKAGGVRWRGMVVGGWEGRGRSKC